MGLFSSKYITTVGTTVSRVVEDKLIIPSIQTGLLVSVFSKDQPEMAENVLESMIGGMGIRAERMYSYAKNKYTLGLPTSKVFTTATGESTAVAVVKAQTNASITLSYYHLGPLNLLHVGWLQLVSNYGYDSATNKLYVLTAQKTYPVYLKDMQVVVNDATHEERTDGSLDAWGTAAKAGFTPERKVLDSYAESIVKPSPYVVDAAATSDSVLLTYVWVVPTTIETSPAYTRVINGVTETVPAITVVRDITHEETLSIPVQGYDLTQDYVHVKYMDGTKAGYWLYCLGAGTYPAIDNIFNVNPSSPGDFFPVIYFREALKNVSADKTLPEYKTAARMMKTLGIDYQEIIDAVHENPDIGQVEQAMMVFAVPPKSTVQIEQRYLFDFFDKLRLASGGEVVGLGWDIGAIPEDNSGGDHVDFGNRTLSDLSASMNGSTPARIRISVSDKRLNTGLSCEAIYKRIKTGALGKIGEYSSSFEKETITNTYSKREMVGMGDGEGNYTYENVTYSFESQIDVFVYKHQISEFVYEELKVYDLKMTYYMWGGYTTVGDDLDPILLVPLDHAITKTYGISERELLYTRSMHYVFNSRIVTKVKWYQKSWFKVVMIIIAIVVFYFTRSAELSMQLIALTAGTMTIVQFVIMLIVTFGPGFLVSLAFKYFVKAVGAEFAFAVAIVAALYGGGKAFLAGSIKGAPWATELLALASNLSAGIGASMQDAMMGLKKEADAFNLLMKEKTDLLDSANKLLERQTLLSPFVIFGEKPDDFYNRTIHSGNIGILGIDSIHSYVDIALTLPKFNDTIEGNQYV